MEESAKRLHGWNHSHRIFTLGKTMMAAGPLAAVGVALRLDLVGSESMRAPRLFIAFEGRTGDGGQLANTGNFRDFHSFLDQCAKNRSVEGGRVSVYFLKKIIQKKVQKSYTWPANMTEKLLMQDFQLDCETLHLDFNMTEPAAAQLHADDCVLKSA